MLPKGLMVLGDPPRDAAVVGSASEVSGDGHGKETNSVHFQLLDLVVPVVH